MDLHPLVVHFPIALLTIYGIMEIVWSKRLKNDNSWFYVKASFLILGVLGAFISLATGDEASKNVTLRNVVHVHEFWAGLSTYIFGFLAVAYIIHFIFLNYPKLFSKTGLETVESIWNFILKIKNWILFTPIKYLLVLAGLIAITVTGALGGAMVHGPNVDPLVSFIYNLLI